LVKTEPLLNEIKVASADTILIYKSLASGETPETVSGSP
jgi:hypothetical protein